MFAIARLWGTAVVRGWRDEVPQLLTLVVVFAAQAYYTLGTPPVQERLYVGGLFAAGLLVASFVPVIFRSENVFSSLRLRILPIPARRLFLLYLLFGAPLRTLVVASSLLWGITGLVLVRATVPAPGAVVFQYVSWAVATMIGMQVAEDVFRRRLPTMFYLVSLLLGLMALQVLVFYSDAFPEVVVDLWSETGQRLEWLSSGDGNAVIEWLWALVMACVAAGLAHLGVKMAARADRPMVPPRRTTRFHRLLDVVAGRISPGAPASYRMELALLSRVAFSRALWIITFGIAAVATFADAPVLLPLAFFGWITFSHNLFGADIPLGGDVRFTLLPPDRLRRFRRRHTAIGLVATLCVATAAAAAFLFGRQPRIGWAGATWLYGISLFALSTVVGDRVSSSLPKPIGLNAVLLEGGFVSSRAWLSIGGTYLLAGSLLGGTGYTIRTLHPSASVEATTLITLVVTSLVYLCVYALSLVAHSRASR
jgi:hypothetical protein